MPIPGRALFTILLNSIILTHFCGNSPTASTPTLATPSAKRKNLLLQHLQRSSMDTDALELEDMFNGEVEFYLNIGMFKSVNASFCLETTAKPIYDDHHDVHVSQRLFRAHWSTTTDHHHTSFVEH